VPRTMQLPGSKPRRSFYEILSEILMAARRRGGANKTLIVYKANLNFTKAEEYLGLLERNGFLESYRCGRTIYKTTDKGIEFLARYKSLTDLVGSGKVSSNGRGCP